MWRLLVFVLLCIQHGGIPFGHLLLEFVWFLDREKIPVLVRMYAVLNELERLETRRKQLRRLCCYCLRDTLLAELQFEIAACRSAIARQLLERKSRFHDWSVLDEEELAADEQDLQTLYGQAEAIVKLHPIESFSDYLELLKNRIDLKERHYLKLLALYHDAPVEIPAPDLHAKTVAEPLDPKPCAACESVVVHA